MQQPSKPKKSQGARVAPSLSGEGKQAAGEEEGIHAPPLTTIAKRKRRALRTAGLSEEENSPREMPPTTTAGAGRSAASPERSLSPELQKSGAPATRRLLPGSSGLLPVSDSQSLPVLRKSGVLRTSGVTPDLRKSGVRSGSPDILNKIPPLFPLRFRSAPERPELLRTRLRRLRSPDVRNTPEVRSGPEVRSVPEARSTPEARSPVTRIRELPSACLASTGHQNTRLKQQPGSASSKRSLRCVRRGS